MQNLNSFRGKQPPSSGRLIVFLAAALLLATRPSLGADTLDGAFSEQRRIQRDATQSQQRIDALDDESRRLLEDYRATHAELDNLETYNSQMQRMVSAQEARIADLRQQVRELDETRRRILPLMLEMVQALEAFVAADTPFLARERKLRLNGLRELLDDPDTGLAEKYRRLLEAYRIEADYAYSIEAYTDDLALEGETLTVDYLRLGRTALYWLSLDGSRSGLWDARDDHWLALDAAHNADIEQAIRVARKQAAPELLRLPIPATEPAR
jgi:hypothetical protein